MIIGHRAGWDGVTRTRSAERRRETECPERWPCHVVPHCEESVFPRPTMQDMRKKAHFTHYFTHTHTHSAAQPPSFRHLLKLSRLLESPEQSPSPIYRRPLSDNVPPSILPRAMSISSFSSLSSYSSESDIGTLLDFNLFKSSSSRPRANANANAHAPARRRSPESPRSKDRRPSSSSRHTHHTRAKRRSITPTRTPVSSSRYDDGARALVPYSLHSPGSKSGISYSDIDRWRVATVAGSDFTYSSESSVTVSSVTSPSYISSASRTRSSRFDSSSRRSATSDYKRLKAPSITSQHPHPSIHHDPTQICEHCRKA